MIPFLNFSQAAKAWEDHCAKNGKPASHSKAKEIMQVPTDIIMLIVLSIIFRAAFAGIFVDREFETHGVSIVSQLDSRF
jgi:hypothetical protein